MDLKRTLAFMALAVLFILTISFANADVTYYFGSDGRALVISPSQYIDKCEEFTFSFPNYPDNYTTDSGHRIQITYYKMGSGGGNPKTETMCTPGNTCPGKKATFNICEDGKYHFTIKHQYRVLGWLTGNQFGTGMFIGDYENGGGSGNGPTANFTYMNTRPGTQANAGYSRLDASSSSGNIVKYKWDFDAGDPVTGHREFYSQPVYNFYWTYDGGNYGFDSYIPVTLTVTDDQGRTDSTTKNVHVVKKCCGGPCPPCPTPTPPCPTPCPRCGNGILEPGEQCENDSHCPCPTDGCQGNNYYNYPSYGKCIGNCTCNTSTASCTGPCKPTISYNDPRCMPTPTPTPPCPTPVNCPEGWIGQPYCKDGDLYRQWQYFQCSTYCRQEERFYQTCQYGCENNQCKQQECQEGYIGERFCQYGDVYQLYRYADCSTDDRKVDDCGNRDCYNGQCSGCHTCDNAPSTPNVYITPNSPYDDDDLVCHAYSTDPEGDTIRYTYTWERDNRTYRTQTTTSTTNTINDSVTDEDEDWECRVKACDYDDCSGTASDYVTIGTRGNFCGDLDLEIKPDYSTLRMTRDERDSMSFSVKNNTYSRVCFDLEGRTSSSYLDAEPSTDYMCLNGKEKKWVSLSIETQDAQCRTYSATLKAIDDCGTDSGSVRVEVSGCGTCTDCIDLIPYRGTVCRGKDSTLRVKVKNNYSRAKRVKLDTSSDKFLAHFDDDEFELDARGSEYADLTVYANKTARLGEDYVYIYARTASDYVREKAYFDVKDCEGGDEDETFEIILRESCTEIKKNRDYNIAFEVRSRSDRTQVVNLQTVSGLETEISKKQITLTPGERETVKFTVRAEKADSAGTHNVEVFGWNSKHRESKMKCIEVEPLSKTKITVKENYLFISQCDYGVFVLLIENQGDSEEHYTLRANNPSPATLTLSEDEFTLKAGETIEIFASVSIEPNIELGDYEFDVIMENSEVYVKTLHFTAIKKQQCGSGGGEFQGLVLTSYPSQAVLEQGKDRNITIKVTNFSDEDLEGIMLEFDLPEGFSTPERRFSLGTGKTRTIVQKISVAENVEDGYYDANVILNLDGEKTVKKMKLVVGETAEAEEETELERALGSAMAGLVTLAPAAGMGLIVLLILILVLLVLGAIVPRGHTGSSNAPVWHRR